MVPSHVERDILIDAPVDTVWRAVAEPDQVSRWFSDAAEIDVRVVQRLDHLRDHLAQPASRR
jgi:uncharacterized protein YndB with AHSA1/START domain